MTQPYLWNMTQNVNIELYANIGDVDCVLYESYLLIEEVERIGVDVGRDRLTDPTLNSIVQLTNQYLDYNINNTPYARMENNAMTFAPSIKVFQNLATPITALNQLTTKQYVDNAVDNSTISITNLG